MKKLIPFLLLSLLFYSCKEHKQINEKANTKIETDSIYQIMQNNLVELLKDYSKKQQMLNDTAITYGSKFLLDNIHRKGSEELEQAQRKYGENQFSESLLTDSLAYVKVYPIAPPHVTSNSFNHRTTSGRTIAITDYQKLVKLIKSRKSYGSPVAACFEPRIAIVMYDWENTPLGYISICLNCNQYKSTLETPQFPNGGTMGFNIKARNELRKLFFSWNFDYYGFSQFVDNEQDYKIYLQTKQAH